MGQPCKRNKGVCPLYFFAMLLAGTATAAPDADLPAIAIIIDDIGYRHREDQQVAELPGPLALSILPHSPHAALMTERAAATGKTVMLHLPMEPLRDEKDVSLGPGALMLDMDRVALMRTLNSALRSVPTAVGVNNHMGSLLTREHEHMRWLMESLHIHDKFFVDSVTSERSVAADVATSTGVPAMKRDVFLDNARDARNLHAEFAELIRIARRRGNALAIGHPHPETIALLREKLPQLAQLGVRLVSVPELLRLRGSTPLLRTAGGSGAAGMP